VQEGPAQLPRYVQRLSEVHKGQRLSGTAASSDAKFQAARPMGDAVRRGVGGILGAQEETHGGTHPRPTAAAWSFHVGHRCERGASRGGAAARSTRPIHATRGLLESLPQRSRAELQHDGAGVPRVGVGLPPPPSLHRGDTIHGAHGPRGTRVDATHGWGPWKISAVAAAVGGVRLRGTNATGCIPSRGGHDVAHLDTRGRRRGHTRLVSFLGATQLFSRVAVTTGNKGRASIPPDAGGARRSERP